jgi:hypothetical protein
MRDAFNRLELPANCGSRTADLKSLTCKQRALPRNFGSIGGNGIIELRVPWLSEVRERFCCDRARTSESGHSPFDRHEPVRLMNGAVRLLGLKHDPEKARFSEKHPLGLDRGACLINAPKRAEIQSSSLQKAYSL